MFYFGQSTSMSSSKDPWDFESSDQSPRRSTYFKTLSMWTSFKTNSTWPLSVSQLTPRLTVHIPIYNNIYSGPAANGYSTKHWVLHL